MSEQEMQELQQEIIDMCDAILEKYDWDGAFSKYMESQ